MGWTLLVEIQQNLIMTVAYLYKYGEENDDQRCCEEHIFQR